MSTPADTAAAQATNPLVYSEGRVVAATSLGESFVRLTVASEDFRRWSGDLLAPGPKADAYVKLHVPAGGGGSIPIDVDDLYGWRAIPEAERGAVRTYTVRCAGTAKISGDRGPREVPTLTIDVVVHGSDHDSGHGSDEDGPGARWVRAARPGDPVWLLGPARGHGRWSAWTPGDARRIVCAGDETAAPALLAIAEELAADAASGKEGEVPRVDVFVEVPSAADAEALSAEAPAFVTVLPRAAAAGESVAYRLGEAVGVDSDAVRSALAGQRPTSDHLWEPATGGSGDAPYVFLAGEASLVKAMRRICVDAAGIPKSAVAFMGYWRRGAAES